MKAITTTLCICILSFHPLQGQTSLFDLSDTKWVVSHFYHLGSGMAKVTYFELYTTSDTLIGDTNYTKLNIRNLCSLEDTEDGVVSNTNFDSSAYELGGLRIDGDQVYFYRFDGMFPFHLFQNGIGALSSQEDHLLYDFDVEVGDTIFYSLGNFDVVNEKYISPDGLRSYEVINSVDESFPNVSDSYIFEDIGSNDGLFAAYYSNFSLLECYDSDTPLNAYECTPCGAYVTNVNEENLVPIDDAILYPNPIVDRIQIAEQYVGQLDFINVYTLDGQFIEKIIPGTAREITLESQGRPYSMLIFEHILKDGRRGMQKMILNR